jgi:hypothetical protein
MEKTQKIESLFSSFRQTMELLDCSKFYLHKLIKKNVVKRYYLEKDECGNPTGKPYFNRIEIEQAFFKEAS